MTEQEPAMTGQEPAVTGSATPQTPAPEQVSARPVRATPIAVAAAVVVVAVFGFAAVILRSTAEGFSFNAADQFGIAGVGLLAAIGILAVTRPRMRADARGVDCRGFFGGYRHVDWDLVTGVEFPPKARFARLVLPGDELVTLYAVQRGDGERSVRVMQGLRALHAASR